jgi:hypothetical protein
VVRSCASIGVWICAKAAPSKEESAAIRHIVRMKNFMLLHSLFLHSGSRIFDFYSIYLYVYYK